MGRRHNNQLPNNLPQLQNVIKKDPASYKQEFLQQLNHYQALLQVFQFNPSASDKSFIDLVMFLAQVSHCYADVLREFPDDLMNVLKLYSTVLHPDTRLAICKALILLRNKSLLAATDIIPSFIDLFRVQNKNLRKFIKSHIVSDIKNMNMKHHDARINATLQNILFAAIQHNNPKISKSSLETVIELYKKNVWRDAKTVNVIAKCCLSKHAKILVAAQTFFLGSSDETNVAKDSDSESDSDREDPKTIIAGMENALRVNKTTRKRKRLLARTKKVVKKVKKESKAPVFNFAAIHLIYDPQGMAEKLLHQLEKVNHRFEIKLLTMNLISRLIGIHELFVFNFYPILQRYLFPRQREVTKILLYAAQSSHELIPPDQLEPLLKTIANNFVSERNTAECMAVGLNAIRELCSRCPLVMNEDLLQDLAAYKSYKNRNVSMAAKSLIQLYRTLNPGLLRKIDRGRPTEAMQEIKVRDYGELDAKDYIPGAECLTVEGTKETQENEGEWEDVEESDDSEGWIDVDQDGDYVNINSDDSDLDENDEGKKEVNVLKKIQEEGFATKAEKASHIVTSRILNQEEFEKLRSEQLAKKLRAARPKRFSNQQEKAIVEELEKKVIGKSELVSLKDIERLYKKARASKEERQATVAEGRVDRGKFGGRKPKMNPMASKSDKEKRKNKTFSMVKHKIAAKKRRRSFSEKAAALKASLVKKLRNSR